MINKIKEAIKLFISNFILFSKIVLTVWLPGSIIIVFLRYYVFPEMAGGDELQAILMEIRISNFIEIAFSPLYGGAIIYALSRIKQGLSISYSESMIYSAKRSFKLLITRLTTGIIIVLGFIALIIPGIILGLRFALVDEAVVLEQTSGSAARKLSAKLTKGKRAKILGTMIVAVIGIVIVSSVLSLVLYLPLTLIGQETNFLLDIVNECLVNVIFSIIYIVLFLFYWESKSRLDSLD